MIGAMRSLLVALGATVLAVWWLAEARGYRRGAQDARHVFYRGFVEGLSGA